MPAPKPIAKGKPRPAILRALGRDDPPASLEIAGEPFTRISIFKHDSMAATALYENAAGDRAVCKFGRTQRAFILPLARLGRRLARHESRLLTLLSDLPVPRLMGAVTIAGRPARTAFARRFIDGHPLAKKERVNDEFFPRLRAAIEAMHARGIAYVDLNKRENIIVDRDGSPHLIDFQISFVLPRGILGLPLRPYFWLLKIGDQHHLNKHLHRHRRDLEAPGARNPTRRPPAVIRLWRFIANPFRKSRRLLLVIIGVRKQRGRAASEYDPEDAVRREFASTAAVSSSTGYDSAECSHTPSHR